MTMRTAGAGVLSLMLSVGTFAQSTRVEFDVASIKENRSLESGGSMRFMPDGGIQALHMSVRSLITIAFGLQPYQLVDAPAWASETFYDIQAKSAPPATRDHTRAMLQTLLIDRFRLSFRKEMREFEGFRLLRSSSERLGPNLRPSQVDCETAFATTPACREGGIRSDSMKAVGAPLWNLLQLIIGKVGVPVSDESGLTGTYDFELSWSNDLAPTDDRPSILTALQEQLGLRLVRRRVTEEVFVVGRLERASPN